MTLRGRALPGGLFSLDEPIAVAGVERAEFRLVGANGPVSGTLVTPVDVPPGMPALIIGHDLASDHRTERYLDLACEYARRDGFAVAILDGPFHGDRLPSSLADAEPGPERFGRMRAEMSKPGQSDAMSADWTLLVDLLTELPRVAASKIGFEAVSMSALLGVTFVADESRVHCAVFHVIGIRTGDQSAAAGPELGGEPFAKKGGPNRRSSRSTARECQRRALLTCQQRTLFRHADRGGEGADRAARCAFRPAGEAALRPRVRRILLPPPPELSRPPSGFGTVST